MLIFYEPIEKHIQCTEEKPQCARCARLGLKCERGLKLIFKEDAVQKGIYFGREGVPGPQTAHIAGSKSDC